MLVDLTNILHKRGHIVEVLFLLHSGPLSKYLNCNVRTTRIDRKSRFDILSMYRTSKILKGFDIVHVHMRYNFRYIALTKVIFGGKYNIIFHDHFGDIDKDRSVPFLLQFLSNLNWYVGVCRPLCEWATHVLRNPLKKVFCLPNIVVRTDHTAQRQDASDTTRIIVVSNFRSSKNLYFALELLKHLRLKGDFTTDFYGRIQDQDYFKAFEAQVKDMQLTSYVRVITDCTNIQSVLGFYDIALHTASMESGPLVLIEYLCHHTPFVAYKTGEVSKQVADVIPEFFQDNFDVEEWVTRVCKVLITPSSVWNEKMEFCYQKYYSEESYYKQVYNIYNSILSSHE